MSSEPTQADRKEATTSPPAVWATMANDVREYDQDNVKRGKGDVDTLLVFAGLFSAVLASFLVAVYPSLQPSPMDVMNYTLQCIANQTASYNFTDGRMIATNPSSPPPPFKASAEDIRVNVLWFASLIISLITSSFGMLVKQWMDDFLAVDIPEPQARLRIRHHRAPQIEAWLVYEIVACLPLLLHLSLGLFFVGLCYFTAAIHASIGYTTLPLVIGWTFCLFSTTALPIFFPRCPYKISLFKPMIARLHRTLSYLADRLHHFSSRRQVPASVPLPQEGSSPNGSTSEVRQEVQEEHPSNDWRSQSMRLLRAAVQRAFLFILSTACSLIVPLLRDLPDEDKVSKDSAADLEIFASIDAMRANDEILRFIVTEELPLIKPSMNDAVSFAIDVLAHRARTVTEAERLIPEWPFRDPFPLDLVRAQAKESISNILRNYVASIRVSYDRNAVLVPLWQQDALRVPDKEQHMVLCTLTMLISDTSNFSEVKLSSYLVDFLRYYLSRTDGPAVCRDILSLIVWHCADPGSCWGTTARFITSLAKLLAPLRLEWQDAASCLHSILCFKITDPGSRDQLNFRAHLTWNYPDDGVGPWEDWNIPVDTPNTLTTAVLEYLFILLLAEFKRVEDSKGSSPEAHVHQETPEALCCTLRHLMKYNGRYLTHSGFQAFVDLASAKSEELMGIMVESLVSTDLKHARGSTSGYLFSRWSDTAHGAIQWSFHIKPSNATMEQVFPIMLSTVQKKLGLQTADHPTPDPGSDIDFHRCLSLCHIAIFLYLAIYAQPDKPELGRELFSSIADTLKRKTEGRGTEIFDDKVARQLAFDCLYIMKYEQEYDGWYDEWLVVFSQSRKTSFPDTLVEVLGQFIPGDDEDHRLYRLRELKERHRSAQPPVDAPLDQQASELKVRSTEQDENPVVAAVDELPDSTTPTYPSETQDLSVAGPSTGIEGGLEGEGRSEGKGRSEGEDKPEGAVDERDSTLEEHEPEASRSGGEGEEGSPDDEIS